MDLDPSLAVGRSRILLILGTIGVAGGAFVHSALLGWGSLAVVALAFGLNTAGKAVHYRGLPIDPGQRRILVASWVLLAVVVIALFGVLLASRFGGEGDFFWPLAVAGVGLALVQRGLQQRYLGGLDVEAE